MRSELLMSSAISCPLWSSVYECLVRTECGMCDVLYAVLNVRCCCFVVGGVLSRRGI